MYVVEHAVYICNYIGKPAANPTIVSYNASAVRIYNATSSLVRFEKNVFFYFEKRPSLLQRRQCSCKFRSLT
jgi:hypothetical protein